MTERKEPGVTFESWVDKQIREAQDRGDFDGLAGSGEPIPAGQGDLWWIKGYLRRENLSADALLPTALQLRKEIERLPATLAQLGWEESVRGAVEDLNARIVDWIRFPTPPLIPLAAVDIDHWVDRWRREREEMRTAFLAETSQPRVCSRGESPTRAERTEERESRVRWWHRIFRSRFR